MRITSGLLSDNMMRNLQSNMKQLDKLNNQLASGKKFSFPSQNPIGVANSMRFNNILSVNEQYIRNINRAEDWLSNTEGVLHNMGQNLQRVRELVVYAGSASLSNDDKIVISEELKELRLEMLALANAKLGDDYIFAGQKTNQAAFLEDGSFNGDDNQIIREIGPGIMITINSDGEKVFKGALDGLEQISNLLQGEEIVEEENELDINSMDDALAYIDDIITINLKERAEIGAKINRLELSENRLQDVKLHTTELLSKNEDVDISEKITELKMQESVYRASLAVGARIIQPTLMDFLR